MCNQVLHFALESRKCYGKRLFAGTGISERSAEGNGSHPEGAADPGKLAYEQPADHVGFEYVGDGNVKTAQYFTEETDTGTGIRHAVNK